MSENNEKKVHGMVAEYTSVDTLLDACRRVRDAGYKKTDAFAPFPVHGIDKALGIQPTVLPWIVLVCGLSGTATGLVMQIWMNAYDYPYIISGKPYISLPAFIPVVFELTVLFASFGAFFGMWALNGLPRFSNPVFTDPRFDRATDDRFFLYIDSKDDRFDREGVRKLFSDTGSDYIQAVVDDDSEAKVPRFVFSLWITVIGLSVIPLLIVLKMRVTTSSAPRFHVFYDMDFSPSKDAQQNTTLFADARAMRPDVPGTVARGQTDLNFQTGIDIDALAAIDATRAARFVRRLTQDEEPEAAEDTSSTDPGEEEMSDQEPVESESGEPSEEQPSSSDSPAAEEPKSEEPKSEEPKPAEPKPAETEADQPAAPTPAAPEPSVMDTTPWLEESPLQVSMEVVERGQKYFGIYCSVCHGMNGGGNGLVNRRAQKILAATWVPPSSLHGESLYADKYPDGKLFNTISNGIRKMPGYASQIRVEDRWAVVAYVRALQRSQNASIDLIPADQRERISKLKSEVDKKLKEQAEAERKAEQERAKKTT